MAKYTAIMLSAGKGSRMGSSVHKQYLLLCGRPVIYYTLKAFEESPVDEIVLVTGEGEEEYCRKEIVEKYKLHKVTKIVKGGKERYHSVFQGLSACEHTDYVLIHDGARPFIGQEVIRHIMDEVQKKHACIAAVPVKDTIKKVDENGKVIAQKSSTEIFIYPGYEFKVVDALITNFHLPKSTLLMLVSAFSTREFMLDVYRTAVEEKYHFFSFGDAMFIY